MVKRALKYAWSVRMQFSKYFFVGISGLLIDMATLIIFREVFGWIPTIAVVVNQVIVLGYNFTLNKYWSFANKEIPHKQLVRYAVLATFNYIFSVGTMYIFNGMFEFDYRVVRIVTIAVMVNWNFFLYKYWVYRVDTPGS
jgi:putative flippase GtrA